MGPGTCDSHKPQKISGRTYMVSTKLTLSCPNQRPMWAWCSPCVVDEKNPSKATFTCPIKFSANQHFYDYMTQHHLQPPPNPPAKNCPVPPAK